MESEVSEPLDQWKMLFRNSKVWSWSCNKIKLVSSALFTTVTSCSFLRHFFENSITHTGWYRARETFDTVDVLFVTNFTAVDTSLNSSAFKLNFCAESRCSIFRTFAAWFPLGVKKVATKEPNGLAEYYKDYPKRWSQIEIWWFQREILKSPFVSHFVYQEIKKFHSVCTVKKITNFLLSQVPVHDNFLRSS